MKRENIKIGYVYKYEQISNRFFNAKMKYFSMFSGVGGFELGIGDGAKCIGFSEINKYARELLGAKWPNIKNYGDATKINPNRLPEIHKDIK